MSSSNLFQIWGLGTVLSTKPLEKLATQFWASWLLTQPSVTASRIARECLAQGKATLPFTWRAKGAPVPKLFEKDGSLGPLFAIEKMMPGSLRILTHPGWLLLALPDSSRSVLDVATRFEPTVRSVFFAECEEPEYEDPDNLFSGKWVTTGYWNNTQTKRSFESLIDLGTLDAFFGALVLEIDNYYKPHVHSHFTTHCVRLQEWRCFDQMNETFKADMERALGAMRVAMAEKPSSLVSVEDAAARLLDQYRVDDSSHDIAELRQLLASALQTT